MRKEIQEIPSGHQRRFRVRTLDDKNLIIDDKTVWALIEIVKMPDDSYRFMLFDYNGVDNEDFYKYINVQKAQLSFNRKYFIARSLKQFFEFVYIIDKPVKALDYTDFVALESFLSGSNCSGMTFTVTNNKSRESLSSCMLIIKDYLKSIRSRNMKYCSVLAGKESMKTRRPLNKTECPKFISHAELIQIHNYVMTDNSLDDETKLKYDVIYRFMYTTGARIGETLGLTIEDLKSKPGREGNVVTSQVIRNRFSDSNDQKAKTCMTINDRSQYKSKIYKTKGPGWQIVSAPKSVVDDIWKYFDTASLRFRRAEKDMPAADCVEDDTEENFYIFANRKTPTPLNVDALENYTRSMFIALGIQVDSDVRINNLLHRFRHGFCMYLLYNPDENKRLTPAQAIQFTRHTSVAGLDPYNNPTEEMITSILNDAVEGIDVYDNEAD